MGLGATDVPAASGASVSLSTEKSFDSDLSPPVTQRGDKLRAQLVPPISSAGQLEKLSGADGHGKGVD